MFSHGTSKARGTCILFRKDFFCNITNVSTDYAGRIICCDINTSSENNSLSLCVIYGPNQDSPAFFNSITQRLADYGENILVIGDFNVAMEPAIDRLNSIQNNHRAHSAILEMCEEYMLSDVWRTRNEHTRRYSWSRGGRTASRIDYALVSKGIEQEIENTCYLQSILTDHSAFYLSIQDRSSSRGAGYWKMNTSILENEEHKISIAEELQKLINASAGKRAVDRWEYIKSKIAKYIKELSKRCADEKKNTIASLCEKVQEYEENFPLSEVNYEAYLNTKADLNDISLERARNLIFKSRTRWYEEGERNTKYFFNLEKSRYNAKTCMKVLKEDGELITEEKEILEELEKYYRDLYKKEDGVSFNITNTLNHVISEQDYEDCKRLLSEAELKQAVDKLKSGRTPGEDGLPAEFYKAFWSQLEEVFVNLCRYCEENHKLPETTRTGILNLLPKQGKDARYIKNRRPITLLNVDYKLIEKALAIRMDKVLKYLIHRDQTGFMKDRRIAANIRKVFDLMYYCNEENLPGVILNLDFAKCFDKIDFSCIEGSFRYFNFPEYMITWVKTLYDGFMVKIQNNGRFSQKFDVKKSVHQGGCASVQIFLLCAEVLAREIRQCESIKGFPIEDIVLLLNQYADDMNVASQYEEESISKIIEIIENYKNHSGFTLSYEKTDLFRIGSLKESEAKLYTRNQIAWTNDPINVLGITVGHTEESIHLNYEGVIRKAIAVLQSWKQRSLSLLGKVCVVNTLVASLFVYKMQVLPRIPEKFVTQMYSAISAFLWNDRKAKIGLSTLQLSKKHGGLNLIDLRARDDAMKISWIYYILKDRKVAVLAYRVIARVLKEDIWRCNLDPKDVGQIVEREKNPFWYDVLVAWSNINFSEEDSKGMYLWNNSLVKINGKVVFMEKPYLNGLKYAHQLYKNGSLISIAEAKQYGLDFMEFQSLVAALPRSWRISLKSGGKGAEHLYDKLRHKEAKIAQIAYSMRKQDRGKIIPKLRWWQENVSEEIDRTAYENAYRALYSCTNIGRLRSFQYRLLQNAIVLNIHLFRWGMRSDNLCSFCVEERETVKHVFYRCGEVQKLWSTMTTFMSGFETKKDQMKMSAKNVLLNSVVKEPRGHIINFITVVVKTYIYGQRCKGLPLNGVELKCYIKSLESSELYIAKKNNHTEKHYRKWKRNSLT